MSNSIAFGLNGNMDIITSSTYGAPQHGNWFVALTGGGTDVISMTLDAPLVSGNTYSISFYDRKHSSYSAHPIEIGLSTVNNDFGTLIYTAHPPVNSVWTQRIFTFVAPNNGAYITVRQGGPFSVASWIHVDNFSFVCPVNITTSNDTTLCSGSPTTISASGGVSYIWSNGLCKCRIEYCCFCKSNCCLCGTKHCN